MLRIAHFELPFYYTILVLLSLHISSLPIISLEPSIGAWFCLVNLRGDAGTVMCHFHVVINLGLSNVHRQPWDQYALRLLFFHPKPAAIPQFLRW